MPIRFRRGPVPRALSTLGLLLIALPQPVAAGDVAPSAYAASQAMPGLFLETPWLIHLYPQASVTMPTQLGATSASSSGAAGGIQAVFRRGSLAFFGLSQENSDLTQVPRSTELFQLGLGWRVGGVRLGGAVRATVGRDDFRNIEVYEDSTRNNVRREDFHGDRVEGAFGIGWGDGDWFVDLEIEAARERFETLLTDFNSRDTLDFDIDGLPVTRYGGAARVGVPGPGNTRLQLVGSFRDRTTRVHFEQVLPDSLAGSVERDDYGHLWRAGLSIDGEVRSSSLRFFALYTNQDGPTFYDRLFFNYKTNLQVEDVDDVRFGAALRRPFWWETTLLVGVQNRFELTRDRTFREVQRGDLDFRSDTTEHVSRQFAWGLRRSFENLDLTGSVRTDLGIEDLFLSLDAIYRL